MKKLVFLVLSLITVGLFVGCASNKIETINGKDIPKWVLQEPASTDNEIYGVGSARMADFETSRKFAIADAHNALAKKVNVTANDETKTTYTGSKQSSDRTYEENSEQYAEAVLKNADIVDTYFAKDGTVYVLMKMPIKVFTRI